MVRSALNNTAAVARRYHNDKVVQYTGKKDVSVHTADGRTQLVVRDVGARHSGNYTCAPENAAPATVTVFVLSGEFGCMALQGLVCLGTQCTHTH